MFVEATPKQVKVGLGQVAEPPPPHHGWQDIGFGMQGVVAEKLRRQLGTEPAECVVYCTGIIRPVG
jgi:hypothetical protein